MVRTCVVKTCRGSRVTSRKKGINLSFFRTPKNVHRREAWCKSLNIQKLGVNDLVCQLHFSESDVIHVDRTVMSDGSVFELPRARAKLASNAVPIRELRQTVDAQADNKMFEEFEQTIKKENHSKELKKCYLGKQILQEEVISNTAAKDKMIPKKVAGTTLSKNLNDSTKPVITALKSDTDPTFADIKLDRTVIDMIFTSNDNSSPGLQDLHTIKKENQAFDYQQEPITQENLNDQNDEKIPFLDHDYTISSTFVPSKFKIDISKIVLPCGWTILEKRHELGTLIIFQLTSLMMKDTILTPQLQKCITVECWSRNINYFVLGRHISFSVLRGLPKKYCDNIALSYLLLKFQRMNICEGIGNNLDNLENDKEAMKILNGWHHVECSRVLLSNGRRCNNCKVLRRNYAKKLSKNKILQNC